ncbi:hypothetical protein OLMES_4040 [Oleiphilus messinensis]|uniref:Uncharacterized protein n=1 Tax=Oleiphilus messinensis TaxID=141451 RepID=A0A1Y0IC04_9GAMM|nr:hypothetical protein OLMES_4040 [Oleiphilus messinensis]
MSPNEISTIAHTILISAIFLSIIFFTIGAFRAFKQQRILCILEETLYRVLVTFVGFTLITLGLQLIGYKFSIQWPSLVGGFSAIGLAILIQSISKYSKENYNPD